MIVAGICIVCLSAPAPGERNASIPLPDWFSMSVPQKLVAAYVLGVYFSVSLVTLIATRICLRITFFLIGLVTAAFLQS